MFLAKQLYQISSADPQLFLKTVGWLEEKLFWAVNNRVLEVSIAQDFKIDYSLDGIDSDLIEREISAIKAIASGKSQEDVAKIMSGSFPFRFREIQVLVNHGYIFEVDKTANIIHWVQP